jgi:hypothetical protein
MHVTPPHKPEHLARSAVSVPVLRTGRGSGDRRGSWVGKAGRESPLRRPTPIRISRGTWNLIVCALIAAMVLILWAVPVILATCKNQDLTCQTVSHQVAFCTRKSSSAPALLA